MAERKTGSGRTTTTKRNNTGTRSSGTRAAGSTASGRTSGSRSGSRSAGNTASRSSGSRSGASRTSGTASRSTRTSSSRSSARSYASQSSYRSKRRKMEEEQLHRDITILLVFVGMIFLFLSNFGILGPVGNTFRDVLTGLFGFTAFLMPVFIFACVVYGMMSESDEAGTRLGCSVALYCVFGVICELISGDPAHTEMYSIAGIWERCSVNHNGGGVVFGSLAYFLYKTLKMPGTILVIITVSVIVFVLLTKESIVDLVMGAAGSARDTVKRKRDEHEEYARSRREREYEEYDDDNEEESDSEAAFEDDRRRFDRRRAPERRPEHSKDDGFVRGIVGNTKLNEEDYASAAAGFETNDPYGYTSEIADPEESYEFYEEHTENIHDDEKLNNTDSIFDDKKLNNTDSYFQGYSEDQGADNNTGDHSENDHCESTDKDSHNVTSVMSAPRYSVAEQIIKEAQSGTDGIDLSPNAYDPFENEDETPLSVYDIDRKPIPIHRESNNLHEINVKDFAESSYASLSQGLYPDDEDEEELTQRIIRDGLIALNDNAGSGNVFNAADGISIAAGAGAAAKVLESTVDSDIPENGIREAVNDITEIEPDSDYDKSYSGSYNEVITETYSDYAHSSEEESDAGKYSGVIDSSDDYTLETASNVYADDSKTDITDHDFEETSTCHSEDNDLYHSEDHVEDHEFSNHDANTLFSGNVTEISGNDEEQSVPIENIHAIDRTMQPIESEPVNVQTQPMAGEHVSPEAMQHAKEAAIHTENSQQQGSDNTVRTSIDGVRVIEHKAEPAPVVPARKKPYVYPPLDLLSPGKPAHDADSDEELRHTAEVLETTLHTFGVSCKITDISQGPAVTRYELLPQVGVKVSKVVSLADDIKLALAATDIRIEAPIPGKSAIGIEVPNKVTSLVALHDVLCTDEFRQFKSKLAFGVGKDISGQIVVTDLAKMPHVLIAGATGSGKSVCINTIIMSILYHSSPEEVKLLMIDPKVVELSVYNGIPHLLYPVVTNPQKAAALLNYAVAEMDQRYRMFAECGVRDIKGYNALVAAKAAQGITEDADGVTLRQMPRLVVIVDELADLMMVAKNDVETAICRLAQLARAAGIHLIIATQRPSVDVITGLIKANMPSRIAFAVTSGTDSRTILDMNGAEKLLGKGDMLFFPQGLPKPARIQGAFVDDDEVSAVVAFIKQNNPSADDNNEVERKMASLVNGEGSGNGSVDGGSHGPDIDDLFAKAGKFIIEKNSASIGLLQRGFRIGFNRAARIMDQLCDAGVVAESEGTKPRKILMTQVEFDSYCHDNDICN